ncbi:MAG: energy-coupling factor transporter transmembrane protein EcfT [Nitrospirae bacterium]|nr:energy-coupling factor transporter transmembrane protein EcfT [Nitrospirota bacterium]
MIPEIRIVLYVCFVISLFLISNIWAYAFLFVVLCLLSMKVPFSRLKSGWVPISLFLFFTFISNLLNRHGRILFEVWAFNITDEGLHIASIRTLRVLFMIMGAKIFLSLTKTEDIVSALGNLLRPLEKIGIPVKDFVHMMGLTLQCFPGLKKMTSDAYGKNVTGKNIEGFWNKVRVISLFLLPLFVRSVQTPEIFFAEEHPPDSSINKRDK